MKSRGLKQAIWAGAFLTGLALALPGPAAATGFIHARRAVPFTHGFQQHRFGHFGHHHQPRFFRDHRGFLHRHDPTFHHGQGFHHHGFHHHGFHHGGFHHPGFYGGSRTIFIWR